MELINWVIPVAGIAAVLFAIYLARDVMSRDTGTPEMVAVGDTIREGADAFVKRQYTTIAVLAVVGAVIIGVVIGLVETPDVADVPSLAGLPIGVMTGIAFLVGAACSMASGIIGMFVSVRSNVRTAAAARTSLVGAVQVAMRGGAVSGFLVVALSLLGVWGIFTIYEAFGDVTVAEAPFLIVGFGFGASFVALFAQLGGGIYTKAADVGSDLVGKVEAGIPEDDPRNAGVIADLVGDNVGDCAGRGADLFESTAAENIGAMILGVAVFAIAESAGWPNPEAWIFFPLVIRAFGLLATILAMFFIRGSETENPMNILNRGYWVTTILSVAGLAFVTFVMMDTNGTIANGLPVWVWFFFAGIVGLATSIAFVYITQYYTAGTFRPVREIAEASRTGPATNIISGTAVGYETTLVTAISIAIALVASHWLGSQANLLNAEGQNVGGIFGTAVATMGMLMTTAYILAMDTFGPITDNAGGVAEFSRSEAHTREITDRLDAVGNTTKALTKGLCDRIGVARRVPALQRLYQQGQPHPEQPRRRASHLGEPGRCERLRRRAHRRHAGVLLQQPGHSGGGHDGAVDHHRGASPVPRDARDHGLQPASRLRARRRHHDPRRAAPDGGPRSRRGSDADPRGSAARLPGGGGLPHGGHHLGRHARDGPQQRRWGVGQRQEVHRVGQPQGRRRQRARQEDRGACGRGRRRHRRRPVQGHGRSLAARAREAARDDHAGARAALHPIDAWTSSSRPR